MTISVACECGRHYSLKKEAAGKVLTCPDCGAKVTVPGGVPAPGGSGNIEAAGSSGLQKKPVNPRFYTISFWGGIFLAFAGGVIVFMNQSAGSLTVFTFLPAVFGALLVVIASTYFFIVLFRCWALLEGSTAKMTPERAVGFLFIPLFNIYWIFRAIKDLADAMNEFIEVNNLPVKKISVKLSLAASVAFVLNAVAILGPISALAGLVYLILFNILIYQWAGFFNYCLTNLGMGHRKPTKAFMNGFIYFPLILFAVLALLAAYMFLLGR